MVYNVPLNYKTGKFIYSQLPSNSQNNLVITHGDFGVLSYNVPKYGTEVRVYDVIEDTIENILVCGYDENGNLDYVELNRDNSTVLVYVNFPNNEIAKETVFNFSKYWADGISDEILKCKEKMARLFIEYFYDGEAVDFAAKIGTVSDMNDVIRKYNGDRAIDNSGDYPYERRLCCDHKALGIMLLCTSPDFRLELFRFAVHIMTEHIKERVLDLIDKTDDFKFIVEEYD